MTAAMTTQRPQAFKGDDLIEAARLWLGTPYMHAQRLQGTAVDCVGLVIGAGNAIGLFGPDWWDITQYSPQVNAPALRGAIDRWLVELDQSSSLWAGDLLLFDIAGQAQHVGLYGPPRPGYKGGTMIHAYQTAGMVCEHDYDRFWRRRTRGRFRWRAWWED